MDEMTTASRYFDPLAEGTLRRRPGPLAAGGGPPGDWPDAVVKRLGLVAQVFTNTLARRR
jgi:hypothetical protein